MHKRTDLKRESVSATIKTLKPGPGSPKSSNDGTLKPGPGSRKPSNGARLTSVYTPSPKVIGKKINKVSPEVNIKTKKETG